ncbi:hypothetical protein DPEC_G00351230 [Dallia pectoralis]|uniref:Uncharacterized protein n=1 Tax=Dallia pectoralis TaxID=75939 RepID=A0ACC2F1Y7_DALPE|nr:hypothetical protein DPEC_G00351230 [Dallia pectoralis]
MWFIIWTALLLTERLCEGRGTSTSDKFSITFSPAEITVQAGQCAVISCTSILPNDAKPFTTLRLKCQNGGNVSSINKNMISYSGMSSEVQQDCRQKVFLLGKGLSRRNCSLIINNIYNNETEEYRFKILKTETKEKTKFENVKITVKDVPQKTTFLTPALKEGEPVTLTCTAPEFGSGSQPNITWKWNRTADNITEFTVTTTIQDDKNLTSVTTTHLSTLTFTPSAEYHGTNVTCIVTFNGTIKIEETVFLNVTLRPVVLYISGCEVQAEVMTCVCICQGEPMPLINWPILKNIPEYNHTTVVSGSLVTSNINLPIRNQTYNSVMFVCQCAGEVKEQYNITQNKTKEIEKEVFENIMNRSLLTAFVIGIAFSATTYHVFQYLMVKYKRRKEKPVKDLDCRQPCLNLEMVTSANQLI